jgi:Protein of unknown function (DUF2752)
MLSPNRSRIVPALAVTGALGLAALCIFDPATSGIFPPCPFRYLTGLYCPGCGSLRAIHQLLHGNLRAAWGMNPLTVILLPFIAYGIVSEALRYWRGFGLPQPFLRGEWIRALCAMIILFGIARNLPFPLFQSLAPGGVLHP